ncbi:sigma-70 family RNA polymerase sigma factor [Amycolatopsis tolypomycina]|uniref:RNA polymerase sigma-70 factor, ECF subfamily n=1 Tax=Amycolatopsis tolypomycina TaxID=208445 RepID=A0A1H4Q0A3_9PSEU|nr:sigma-70 family RNA polymerase sigma factor [Amycolatopsis tolypomycina]SEC13024.1 RNA polymerase sigma-70 factor, ECF subfamily [Amycolatopsis tolypomycina]
MDALTERFEQERPRLRAVAYRMLGSAAEADDAVQEAWLRFHRTDASEIDNLPAWLTTVVARICLSLLRTRRTHREEPLDGQPEPDDDRRDPEQEAELADSVGLALLVVLDALGPAERVAFVLHDMFAVPFDEIAPVIGKTPAATRQLASRARRRVKGGEAADADLPRRRKVVEAFLAASRGGDFEALLALLDPDVVLHADRFAGPSPAPIVLRGVESVRRGAILASERARASELALVDGTPGLLMVREGRLAVVLKFQVDADRITGIEVIADPERLAALELAVL